MHSSRFTLCLATSVAAVAIALAPTGRPTLDGSAALVLASGGELPNSDRTESAGRRVAPAAGPATATVRARPTVGTSVAQDVPRAASISGEMVLDTEGVTLPGGQRIATPCPIARALEWAAPGARLSLTAGDYGSLGIGHESSRPWNSRAAGGTELRPVRVVGRGRVRILGDGHADAITIHQQVPCAHIHFEDIVIQAGNRAGVLFSDVDAKQAHTGFHFYDCAIDGGYDHIGRKGTPSKWGVLGHALSDFVFAGRRGRASVHDTCHEHAFYLQNPRGNITIEKVDAYRLGRTFVQIVARERSGPVGRGLVRVIDCHVRDAGIAERDGYKGGSAFTFAGRLTGCTIVLERNRYRAGFDAPLLKLRNKNQPYGTGALVSWDEGSGVPNGVLVLRENDFEMAEGTGDRTLVAIGSMQRVIIDGDNRFVSGGTWPALALDPVKRDGTLEGPPNGAVQLDPGNAIEGPLLIGGERPSQAELDALAVPLHER